MPVSNNKIALTIAGSDSGGGAGIQSDIKTFYNIGVYGLSVITSITAQNSKGVISSFELPGDVIYAQLDAVLNDYKIKFAKTGMLSSDKVIKVIASSLETSNIKLIVDPLILSKNKYMMLSKKGIEYLKELLLPQAYIVCPNLHEASVLSGVMIHNIEHLYEAALKLKEIGTKYILLKGGHFDKIKGLEPALDILFDGKTFKEFSSVYVNTKNTHGTGCVFSAALTAYLCKGLKVEEAISNSKKYLNKLLKSSKKTGNGIGPVEQVRY